MTAEALENLSLKEFRENPNADEFETYSKVLVKVWNLAIDEAAKKAINKKSVLKLLIETKPT